MSGRKAAYIDLNTPLSGSASKVDDVDQRRISGLTTGAGFGDLVGTPLRRVYGDHEDRVAAGQAFGSETPTAYVGEPHASVA